MIRYATRIMLTISLLILGGFTAAYAQMNADTILKVKIPNSFVLRDKTYPAGEYTIKPTDDPTDSEYILELSGANGKPITVFDTVGATVNERPKNTELVFEKIGDQYFLSKIWVKGLTNGNEVEKSNMEKELVAAGQPSEEYDVNEVRMISKKVRNH